MVNMYVDSREPASIKILARKMGFIEMALECGDYSTDKMIVERKKIGDFINSSFSRYGQPPRIYEQLDHIFDECERTERIPCLLITGRLHNKFCPKCGTVFQGAEQEFKDRGQTLNFNAVTGAFASIWTRYRMNLIWTEQPPLEWLTELASIMEKVDEGKLEMKHQRKLKTFARDKNTAVIARALDLQPKKAEVLAKNIGGLATVLETARCNPSKIYNLPDIGSRTLLKIKDLAGIS